MEAELLGVEVLAAVDVRDRHDDDLDLPVHGWSSDLVTPSVPSRGVVDSATTCGV
jgi:hypothetical protein